MPHPTAAPLRAILLGCLTAGLCATAAAAPPFSSLWLAQSGDAFSIDLGEADVVSSSGNDGPISAEMIENPLTDEDIGNAMSGDAASLPGRPSARPWLPGLVRSVVPDTFETFIPQSAFDRMESGPTPEQLERRQQRRQLRQLRRGY